VFDPVSGIIVTSGAFASKRARGMNKVAGGSTMRVALIAIPSTSASGLFGIRDALGSVGVAFESFVANEPTKACFDVSIVAATQSPFVCASGTEIRPDHSVATMPEPDVVVIPGLSVSATERSTDIDKCVVDWIIAQHTAGKQVAATCTGVIILAEAGLLDGKEATTHWAWRDYFRTYYPRVLLRLEKSLCCADREHRIVTSGGATNWQELVLYLITRHVGLKEAVRTAKFWLLPWQGELQSPYASMPHGIPHSDREIAACQTWIAENYTLDNPVARMVKHSGLTRSTFRRRFVEATGYTAIDYVHSVRIEEAKQLLETTDDALDCIAQEVGYGDEASFRKLFKRMTGISPSNHRKQFGVGRFRRLTSQRPMQAAGRNDRSADEMRPLDSAPDVSSFTETQYRMTSVK
jgi:transcriptional regulator GlxA family with amidase domain